VPDVNPTPAPPPIDPAQTRVVLELKHTSPLLGCRFSPCGRFVFAGAQDNSVQRWHLDGGKKTALAGHKSWVRGLAFAAKEQLLFSGSYDGKLLTWPLDAETPTPVRTIDAHKGWVRALAVSPDGKLLASCGNDHMVRLWNIADGTPIRAGAWSPDRAPAAGHACHVYNVAFHPKQPLLVSGDLKGTLKVWDVARGTVERELDAKVLHKYDATFEADHGGIRSMAFSADGALLACAGITDVTNAFAGVGKPAVVLFDWASGKQKFLLRPRENFQGTMWGVVQFPTGLIAACAGGNGGMLLYWKPDAAADVFALKLPNNARDLDLHPDGRRLAVAFADGAVRVYDAGPKG
jgi:WD40 repeat protein